MRKSKLTHGSLFSGFDAPSVAASWLDWENAFHCEINPFCNEILKYWFPNSEHYEDITKTDFKKWREKIDVLTGGFPCQPFSLAGRRKGADDNRYLWPHMLRAIREIRPTWVIGENVAGILTMVQPGKETEWDAKPLFSERITEKEYCYDKNTLSKPSVKTLSEKDTPSNRCLFRLVPSERHIEETECGLLPTVQTQWLKMCDKRGKIQFYPRESLPTSMPTDIHHAERVRNLKDVCAETMASRENGSNRPNGLMDFMDFHGMLPTPTASCRHNGCCKERKDGTSRKSELNHCIAAQIGKSSQLNPLFVEEMMGFPLMWTTLPFLSQDGDRNQSKDTEMP